MNTTREAELLAIIAQQQATIARLQALIAQLEARIKQLEDQLAKWFVCTPFRCCHSIASSNWCKRSTVKPSAKTPSPTP
jgi:hypothetical protein